MERPRIAHDVKLGRFHAERVQLLTLLGGPVAVESEPVLDEPPSRSCLEDGMRLSPRGPDNHDIPTSAHPKFLLRLPIERSVEAI
jgi:hypothetical protein